MSNQTVICFGEVLWDVFPSGKVAGGAPMNVACHINNFGLTSKMISRVGEDDLGKELLAFLENKGIATDLIQKDNTCSTGIVNVKLDAAGSASYEIVQPVAWDFIHTDGKALAAVQEADLLVFGSLASRSAHTKKTLLTLLPAAKKKVFDVNLRSPFHSKALLEELLFEVDIVKMNDDELKLITRWYSDIKEEAEQMHFLKNKFGLDKLIVTRGKAGAACLDETGLFMHPGFSVEVQDTVGSGDSFLAAFLKKMLAGEKTQDCLEFGCATGSLVATKSGGTPDINEEMVYAFMQSKL